MSIEPPAVQVKWSNRCAIHPNMIVEMNGIQTVNANNSQHPSGPISLQFGGGASGPIKWRKVMVRPL